jgi:hypothetical protein
VVGVLGALGDAGAAAPGRPSLVAALTPEVAATLAVPSPAWRPFPVADDRPFWEGLPEPVRRELIDQGEAHQAEAWAPIPATVFLEFYRSGSKEPYQTLSFGRRQHLGTLVLAECAEGKGRFLDAIVNGIWAICEESFWGNSTNTWLQSPIEDQRKYASMRLSEIRTTLPDVTRPGVDLWVGETAGLLAMTDYLLGARLDRVSPMVRPRLRVELERRMLTPCLERDFKWMEEKGNWNPWICSNWLAAVLLVEADPARRAAALRKILAALDHYLAHTPADGGCDEGPGYWRRSAAALFDCLELIHSATDGRVSVYGSPFVREIARFIYRVQIADDYFYNFNDAPGRMSVPGELAVRFGRRIDDPHLIAFGQAQTAGGDALNRSGSLMRRVPALQELTAGAKPRSAAPPYARDTWLPDLQVMTARAVAGSTAGLFLAAKAGHNGESHNHNDVGDFVVFSDGKPVIVDIGPEAYTAENSGPNRYDIWTMSSAWHNLPTIGGATQQAGARHGAREVSYFADDEHARLSMELAGAYPAERGLVSWVRTVQLRRRGEVRLSERFALNRPVDSISLSFVTPCPVRQVGPGELEFLPGGEARAVWARYPEKLNVKLETVILKDRGLRQSWGGQITRVLLVAAQPALTDEWTVTFQARD